jgi:hypothetical protein
MRSVGLTYNGESTGHGGTLRSRILLTCSITNVTFGGESGESLGLIIGPGGEL